MISNTGRYFTWQRYARLLLTVVALMGAFEVWRYREDSAWTMPALTVIPVVAWILAAQAIRWRQLMSEEQSGALNIEQYKAAPLAYLQGSTTFQAFTVGGALTILVLSALIGVW